jgi:hypothetical protein
MNKTELVEIIIHSSPADWRLDESDDDESIAIYLPDESIEMRWSVIEELNETWAKRNPSNDSDICYLGLFNRGILLVETRFASVDCNRAYLPIPDKKDGKTPSKYFQLVKLINYISNPLSAAAYFESYSRSNTFEFVDREWP